MRAFKPLFLLLSAGCALPTLADDHIQHGAHEHGTGRLDIAREGGALQIELSSPAANIVGFEHVPKTEADHGTLEKALARLEDGAQLFLLPNAAGCRLVDADIATPLEKHGDSEEHHAHRDTQGQETDTHSDIMATWRFSCAHSEELDRVTVKLFDAFPMTQRLRVQFVTGKHQGAADLSASNPILRF